MTECALEIEGVTKRYGTFTAVDNLSVRVPAGSIYGFLGPNGAGKTTTLRMVLEILKPTSGSIQVLGSSSALDVRDRIGYLPEEKGLYKKMKAWASVAYFASLKGMPRKAAATRAYELLNRYGLGDFADSKVEALSKGMSQKVQVIGAIAHDPDFVILDEPFSGLDPVNQQVMEELILDMAARGRTVIFSTHVMSHAERICDRILLIARGKKAFDGTLDEARATIPKRVLIGSPDSLEPLKGLPSVLEIRRVDEVLGGGPLVEVLLGEAGDPQGILQTCISKGIRLRSFDHTDPSLHDVFVHLVGDEAREARAR